MLKNPKSLRFRFSGLAVGFVAWLAAAPAPAETPRVLEHPPAPAPPDNPLDDLKNASREQVFEEVIKQAYQDLVQWTEPSEEDLSFELRNFVHIPRVAFGSVFATDVATLPGGDTVVAGRYRYTAGWTDEERVMYVPTWKSQPEYLKTPAGQKEATLRLDEVLQLQMPEDSRLRDVSSLTTYEVTVSLQGRERTYQAAFAWLGPEPKEPPATDESELDAIVLDHVTVGVGATLAETAPMGSRDSLPRREGLRPDSEDGSGAFLDTKSACTAGDVSREFDESNYFTTDHASGGHGPFARFKFDCSCRSDCGQTCTPSLSHEACQEAGETYASCHRISFPSFDVRDKSSPDTTSQGTADCGAAIACAWKACRFCSFCGSVSVGVSWGVSLSITSSPDDAATISMTKEHQCQACATDSEDGSQDGSGGGGSDEPLSDSPDHDDGTWDGFEDGCNCTPIVVNLGMGPIRLSGLDDPVQFNLDDDSRQETLSWTERGSDVAFLVHDRDGDGAIRLGAELFGAYTPQPASDDPNGFRALDLFDRAWLGGNEDGWITAEDRIFDDLMLWVDSNHDAVADDFELFTLRDHGIEAIELDFKEHRWRDRHGNEFRYSSRVRFAGGRTDRIVDVILLHGSP